MAQYSKRGRNNNRRRQGGNNNPNRSMDSQGPEVKIRGTAAQIFDKYQALARDAASAGDRIRAESLMQHAEHYYRLMKSMQPDKPDHKNDGDNDSDDENQNDQDQNDASDNGHADSSKSERSSSKSDKPEEADAAASSTDKDESASEEPKPRRRRRRKRADETDNEDGGDAKQERSEPQLEEAAAK
ncbi:MAG: DUF4167 domain-containing protein [Parvularcula sp.]|jgi:hypothetical protein|nr:DUF4167 domain-containing protein [Parvularcula sp.]